MVDEKNIGELNNFEVLCADEIVDDGEFVASVKASDSYAFDMLVKKYRRYINRYVYTLRIVEPEREDMVQEGLIGLLKAVRTYDGVSSSFSTYAFRCISTSISSAMRKYNRDAVHVSEQQIELLPDEEGDSSPESVIIDAESAKRLHERFSTVLSHFESVVLEMYLAGCSYSEIGLKMNKNAKSIDNALQRIKNKLRRLV